MSNKVRIKEHHSVGLKPYTLQIRRRWRVWEDVSYHQELAKARTAMTTKLNELYEEYKQKMKNNGKVKYHYAK